MDDAEQQGEQRTPREYGPILRVRLPYDLKVALDQEVQDRHSTRSAVVKEMLAYCLGLDNKR